MNDIVYNNYIDKRPPKILYVVNVLKTRAYKPLVKTRGKLVHSVTNLLAVRYMYHVVKCKPSFHIM